MSSSQSHGRRILTGLVRIEAIFIIIAAIYIAVIALAFSFLRIAPGMDITMIMQGIGCAVLSIPLIALAYHAFMKVSVRSRYIIAFLITLLIGGIWTSLICNLVPYDDQLVIATAAKTISKGESFQGVIGARTQLYMERYPYQSAFALYMALLSRIFGAYPFTAARVINVVIMSISVLIVGRISYVMFRSRGAETATLLLCILFIPISMSSYKVYGNILVLPFMLSALLMALHVMNKDENHRIRTLTLLALSSLMSIAIKPNSMIVIIAMVITLVMSSMTRKRIIPLIAALLVIMASIAGNIIPPAIYGSMTDSDMSSNRVHYKTWIAIGIVEKNGMYGFYDGSYFPYREKQVPAKNKKIDFTINRRLNEFKSNPRTAIRFYWMKTGETWGDPSFGVLSDNYLQMKAWRKSKANVKQYFKFLTKSESGIPAWSENQQWFYAHALLPTQAYSDGMQIIISLLIVIGLIITNRRIRRHVMSSDSLMLGLAFLGGFIFHLFWETQPEYAFPYFLILIPYAGLGMDVITKKTQRILHHYDRTKRGISTTAQDTARSGDSGLPIGSTGKVNDGHVIADVEEKMRTSRH
jgi:hypothetical protein